MSTHPFIVEIVIDGCGPLERARLDEVVGGVAAGHAVEIASFDPETSQAVLRGRNLTQLDQLIGDIRCRMSEAVTVGTPHPVYHEVFARPVEVDFTIARHSGPTPLFGRVLMKIEPHAIGTGIRFVDASDRSELPTDYISAVERAVFEVAAGGALIGAPIVDFTATLLGGVYHDIDSSPSAFVMAGRGAMRKAASDAGMNILEPIMRLAILASGRWHAPIVRDIEQRRGNVDQATIPGVIVATAPLAELFSIERDLAVLTANEAAVAMMWDHHAMVAPSNPPDDSFPAAAALRR